MTEFKPGDRVVYTGQGAYAPFSHDLNGHEGTVTDVVDVVSGTVRVKFDGKDYSKGIYVDNLELVEKAETVRRLKPEPEVAPDHNPVNHPKHYTSHPSGVECITITQHMGFNLGNAFKYIWRADLKGNSLEDLRKAKFYLDVEIAMREKAAAK